jgi:hypothetical protein
MGDVIDMGDRGFPVNAAFKTVARLGAKPKTPCAAAN